MTVIVGDSVEARGSNPKKHKKVLKNKAWCSVCAVSAADCQSILSILEWFFFDESDNNNSYHAPFGVN